MPKTPGIESRQIYNEARNLYSEIRQVHSETTSRTWIQSRHWERFSAEVNIKPRLVLQTLKEMGRNIFPRADDLTGDFYDNFGKAAIVGKIHEGIKKWVSGVTG